MSTASIPTPTDGGVGKEDYDGDVGEEEEGADEEVGEDNPDTRLGHLTEAEAEKLKGLFQDPPFYRIGSLSPESIARILIGGLSDSKTKLPPEWTANKAPTLRLVETRWLIE